MEGKWEDRREAPATVGVEEPTEIGVIDGFKQSTEGILWLNRNRNCILELSCAVYRDLDQIFHG
jgi:hypothetical protein